MTDLVSKGIAMFLALMLGVIIPLTTKVIIEDMVDQRGLMNEMCMFIDEVVDTGKISDAELADFQLACASYGPVVQIEISRWVKTIDPDPVTGGTYKTYVFSENNKKYSQGDRLKVRVYTIGYTGAQRVVMNTIGRLFPKFDVTFAGRIR